MWRCSIKMTDIHYKMFLLKIFLVFFFFFSVSRGAFPYDEWEHQPACPLVVHCSDAHPHHYWNLADEAPEKLLRSQETGLICLCGQRQDQETWLKEQEYSLDLSETRPDRETEKRTDLPSAKSATSSIAAVVFINLGLCVLCFKVENNILIAFFFWFHVQHKSICSVSLWARVSKTQMYVYLVGCF